MRKLFGKKKERKLQVLINEIKKIGNINKY